LQCWETVQPRTLGSEFCRTAVVRCNRANISFSWKPKRMEDEENEKEREGRHTKKRKTSLHKVDQGKQAVSTSPQQVREVPEVQLRKPLSSELFKPPKAKGKIWQYFSIDATQTRWCVINETCQQYYAKTTSTRHAPPRLTQFFFFFFLFLILFPPQPNVDPCPYPSRSGCG